MNEKLVNEKFLYAFRDNLIKHLMDMKERPQMDIINETYNKVNSLIELLLDKEK